MVLLLLESEAINGAARVESHQSSQPAQIFFLHAVRAIILRCP